MSNEFKYLAQFIDITGTEIYLNQGMFENQLKTLLDEIAGMHDE